MKTHDLMQRYFLGIASADETRELEQVLLKDEQAQLEYLLHADVDAHLRREAQIGSLETQSVPFEKPSDSKIAKPSSLTMRQPQRMWKLVSGLSTLSAAVLLGILVFRPLTKAEAFSYPSLGELAVNVSWSDRNIWTAAGQGRVTEIHSELERDVPVDSRLHNQFTPLHVAALYRQVDSAELLIAEGAKVELTDDEGNTALHIAAFLGQERLVSVLLKAGADPQQRNRLGFSASDLVAIEWNSDLEKYYHSLETDLQIQFDLSQIRLSRARILRLLSETVLPTENPTPSVGIWHAVVVGNLRAVTQHIEAGTDLDSPENLGGSTPLMLASIYGQTEIARLLIEAGAKLERRNKSGDTALHLATFFCRTPIVHVLLKAGCDPNQLNRRGQSAFDVASLELNDELLAVYRHVYDLVGLEFDVELTASERPRILSLLQPVSQRGS